MPFYLIERWEREMWETIPMVAGWRIFRARWMPAWLLPAAWDMVKFSVAFFLLPRAGLFLARWDFTLGVDIAGTGKEKEGD
jgi:hypothetical protein